MPRNADYETINKSIQEFQRRSGASATEIAAYLGITTASLLNKRSGKSGWKWTEILKLSDLTGVDVNSYACAEFQVPCNSTGMVDLRHPCQYPA